MQLSYLGTCVLYLHIPSSLGAHHREWLQSDGSYMAGILLLPKFPQGSPAHTGGLQSARTMAALVH